MYLRCHLAEVRKTPHPLSNGVTKEKKSISGNGTLPRTLENRSSTIRKKIKSEQLMLSLRLAKSRSRSLPGAIILTNRGLEVRQS